MKTAFNNFFGASRGASGLDLITITLIIAVLLYIVLRKRGWETMKTAKEMFEELGYKRVENHPKEEKDKYTFTTQDNPYIK